MNSQTLGQCLVQMKLTRKQREDYVWKPSLFILEIDTDDMKWPLTPEKHMHTSS